MIFSTLALSSSAVFAAPTGAPDKFPKRLVLKNLKVDITMYCNFKIGVFNNHKEEGFQVEGLGFVKRRHMQLLGDDVLVGSFQHPALNHGYGFRTSSTKHPVQHPECTKENSYNGVAGQSYYSKDVTMTFARVLINQKKGDYIEIPNDPVSPDLE